MIEKINEYKTAKGPRKWLLWVSITLTVIAMSVGFYFWHKAKTRQIIKLKAEAAKAAIKAEDTRIEILNTNDKTAIKELAAKANEWQHLADRIRGEAAVHEKEVSEKLRQLSGLKTWIELDKYNKQGRS